MYIDHISLAIDSVFCLSIEGAVYLYAIQWLHSYTIYSIVIYIGIEDASTRHEKGYQYIAFTQSSH